MLSEEGAATTDHKTTHYIELPAKVEQAGGQMAKPVFSFPSGCRFHFIEPSGIEPSGIEPSGIEPSGNELAVWSDLQEPVQ